MVNCRGFNYCGCFDDCPFVDQCTDSAKLVAEQEGRSSLGELIEECKDCQLATPDSLGG